MAFVSDIGDFTLSELIQMIGMGRKTGKLIIEQDSRGCCIYFKDGTAAFAHPLYQKDKLGNLLVKSGAVKAEHIEAALYKQKKLPRKKRRRIGTILVDMGFLAKEDLVFLIENEIKDTVYRVLSEKRGKCEFINDFDLDDEDVIAQLNVETVILDGVRQVDEWHEVRKVLGDFDGVYAISVDPEFDFGKFSVNEWKVITLIDGKRSINEITTVAKLDKLKVCKTLALLLKAGIIRLIEISPEKEKTPITGFVKPKTSIMQKILEKIRSI